MLGFENARLDTSLPSKTFETNNKRDIEERLSEIETQMGLSPNDHDSLIKRAEAAFLAVYEAQKEAIECNTKQDYPGSDDTDIPQQTASGVGGHEADSGSDQYVDPLHTHTYTEMFREIWDLVETLGGSPSRVIQERQKHLEERQKRERKDSPQDLVGHRESLAA